MTPIAAAAVRVAHHTNITRADNVDITLFMFNPILWFPPLFLLWAGWQLCRWASSGGRRSPRRSSRFTRGGLEGASSFMHELYGPGVRPRIERAHEEETDQEDDDDGGPLNGGHPESAPASRQTRTSAASAFIM